MIIKNSPLFFTYNYVCVQLCIHIYMYVYIYIYDYIIKSKYALFIYT